MIDFFRRELAAGRENYLRRRTLRFRINSKRRLHVSARPNHAYVWQAGRFKDDERYWTAKIGPHANIKPVREDKLALRFFLTSEEDFAHFSDAVQNELPRVEFLGRDNAADLEDEE